MRIALLSIGAMFGAQGLRFLLVFASRLLPWSPSALALEAASWPPSEFAVALELSYSLREWFESAVLFPLAAVVPLAIAIVQLERPKRWVPIFLVAVSEAIRGQLGLPSSPAHFVAAASAGLIGLAIAFAASRTSESPR